MSVRVRLTRVGSKKNPIWRVVVADQRSPRDGRFIETIGHYNPQTEPSTIVIDEERLQHWVARGAQPTNTVKQLVKAHAEGHPAAALPTGSAGVSRRGAVAAAQAPAEADRRPRPTSWRSAPRLRGRGTRAGDPARGAGRRARRYRDAA